MHDDEGGKEPSDQGVEGGHEGETAELRGQIGPTLHAPHDGTGDNLEREEEIEDSEVGDLL